MQLSCVNNRVNNLVNNFVRLRGLPLVLVALMASLIHNDMLPWRVIMNWHWA